MAATVVTVNNAIASAAGGLASRVTDCTGRVSSNVNCLVAILHSSQTAQSCRWDVCAADEVMTTVGEIVGTHKANNLKAFFLMNPTAGEHIVRALTSGSAEAGTGVTGVGRVLGVYSLASAADSGTIGSFVGLTGTTDNLSAQVVSTANEIVIDANHFSAGLPVSANAVLSAGTDQAETYDRRPAGNANHEMASSWQAGETSTRMSWGENFGAGATWTHLAFNVVATGVAAPAGATPRSLIPLMGAGRL